jgi:hypothetical protein
VSSPNHPEEERVASVEEPVGGRVRRSAAIVTAGAVGFALGLGGFAAAQFAGSSPTASRTTATVEAGAEPSVSETAVTLDDITTSTAPDARFAIHDEPDDVTTSTIDDDVTTSTIDDAVTTSTIDDDVTTSTIDDDEFDEDEAEDRGCLNDDNSGSGHCGDDEPDPDGRCLNDDNSGSGRCGDDG